MTKFLLCFALFISIAGYAFSQSKNLKIIVRDEKYEFLAGAHVQITNKQDGLQKSAVADANGKVVFENINDGLYLLKISFIGYKTVETLLKVNPAARSFEYKMKPEALSLNEVIVSAPKPLIRQEEDKTIIDPEPVANTSTNTMEVIESTPGLYVDQDGGIYISGMTPAAIYINGREQKLSTQDLATILKSLPPNSVEKIEVIRNPSTKYDAATTGGIVNIVLKKGVKLGRFGSASIGANQGYLGSRFGGFTLNNSNNKLNTYINFNFNSDGRYDNTNSNRRLTNDTLLKQVIENKSRSNQGLLGYGLSYDYNDSLNFSYDGRVNAGLRSSLSESDNDIEAEQNLMNSTNTTEDNVSFINIQQDLGMLYKMDTLGSQWENKLSYSFNSNNSLQDYTSILNAPIYQKNTGNGEIDQKRHFLQFQSDFTYNLLAKIKLETGIKSSLQSLINNSGYYIDSSGYSVNDLDKTRSFKYFENINAVYAQASKKLIAEIILKAGIRAEQTYMDGRQTTPQDTSFKQNRIDFFPYIYLSRRLIKMMGIELFTYIIYRRTITRPDYQELIPAIRYVDEFTYETGNPALKPQYTDNIEWNISFNDFPVFALGRNFTHNLFSSVIYKDSFNSGLLIRTTDNIGYDKETYLRGMIGIPPGRVYFFGLGAQYSMNEYDGLYQNQPLKYKHGSWRFFTFHQLKITKETKLTVSGFMMTDGFWNFYELKNFGQINIGLTQNFLDRKLTVTVNMRDVLRTNVNRFTFNQGGIYSYGDRYTDNQRIGINIRYNFGVKTKEEKKQMFKMNEEESN